MKFLFPFLLVLGWIQCRLVLDLRERFGDRLDVETEFFEMRGLLYCSGAVVGLSVSGVYMLALQIFGAA